MMTIHLLLVVLYGQHYSNKDMNTYLEKRNYAIDLLRALTMAMMLMVNDFWSVDDIPHWMEHAA